MPISTLAIKLAKQHGTRNPFRIASDLGYIIIETPLTGVRGYYQYIEQCHIIYLDSRLTDQERLWVCAHELGHSILHRGLNRIFMDTHTHMISNRCELEADRFAVELLFSDEDLKPLLEFSTPTVANILGVSLELADYRMARLLNDSGF